MKIIAVPLDRKSSKSYNIYNKAFFSSDMIAKIKIMKMIITIKDCYPKGDGSLEMFLALEWKGFIASVKINVFVVQLRLEV